MPDDDIESRRFEFEREKWREEQAIRERDQTLKEAEGQVRLREARRSAWLDPLVIGIFTAALAAAGNALVTFINGQQQQNLEVGRPKIQSDLERQKDEATIQLERDRAEATRILEIIKAGNPSQATNNLKFLLDTKLISTPATVAGVKAYLESQPSVSGPAFLPSGGGSSPVKPGSQLFLLNVGISAYNEDYARSLRLEYADSDAHDLASALVDTQGTLYSQVRPWVLVNKDAQ